MKTIIANLFLLVTTFSYSQTPYIDTLKKRLQLTTTQDTQYVVLISELAAIMAYVRPDSALLYSQQGISVARKLGFVKGEILCKGSMGEAMWIAGDYANANALLASVLTYAKSVGNYRWQINISRVLSANNRDQGDYEEALKYSYQAIEIANSHKELFAEQISLCYLEAGANYEEMNRLDSALHYLQRVRLPADANSGYTGFKYLMMGRSYDKMGSEELALQYYQLSIQALTGTNNYKDFATVYSSIAKLYQKKGKTDSCIYYARQAFNIARTGSFKKGIYETSLLLAGIYERRDDGTALQYFKTAMAAKDSMFNLQKTTQFLNAQFNEQMRRQAEEADKISYQNKIRTYIMLAVLGFFLLLAIILYRNNQQKQKAKTQIEEAYKRLQSTQAQLIQSEKMASLGELTAGIAHEIQNPLNFVNNFSELNTELIEDMNGETSIDEMKMIANDIKKNNEKINYHGKRADAIVKGMLQHSHQTKGVNEPTDLNALCDEYLRLSYHGLRAKDKNFSAEYTTHFDQGIGKINMIPQDIGRVLLNLFNNAFFAVNEKKKYEENYQPVVSISTKQTGNEVIVAVTDNGIGIPSHIKEKIFQPFFTTKPTGQGTGLGLSISYDIVTKEHNGFLTVESKEGEGSRFVIHLPLI